MKLVDLDATEPYLLDGRYNIEPARHGRWETDGILMDDGEYLMTRCTVCGTPYEYGHNDNYCGYCGAKMDGGENG